jgi:hypothetical protein
MFGDVTQRFPTNLRHRSGATVHFPDIFDLLTDASPYRDLPVFKSFHSKNDVGDANHWGPEVVINYTHADSAGHGMALYWSERAHGIDTGPDFDDHWVNGNTADQQTIVDDVAYGEARYRSDVSYPAFFNHRLDPAAMDPGDGTPGTGPDGSGDDWGTWGGWHRWDTESIIDLEDAWSVEAWLESEAMYPNDNSPHDMLTADLAIRRPQHFLPQTGQMVYWWVEDAVTAVKLQGGTALVGDDDLVSIEDIRVFREALRKVRIVLVTNPVASEDIVDGPGLPISPNPSTGFFSVSINSLRQGRADITLYSMEGEKVHQQQMVIAVGENWLQLDVVGKVRPGMYLLEVIAGGELFQGKLLITE